MKTHLILIMALVLLTGFLSAQDNKASVQLTAAIYEEEVTGNLDKAVELYLDILKKYPENRLVASKTLYHLGLVNEKMGQQKAVEYFTRLINTYPDQTEMVALAKARLAQLTSSTTETSLKAGQSFRMAADLFNQFKYESAVAEYEKVIKLAPKSQLAQEAQLWTGQCYFKEGKYDQALKSFNAIIKEYPGGNMIPVTELMISQVNQAVAKEPKKSTVIILDDKTILDTVTGVKYTKIKTWAGKNDIIKSAFSITDVSPNRKFLLAGNKVFPFDNSDPFIVFDTLLSGSKIRLSPDRSQIAHFGENGISVMPVSTETGRPTGPAQKLLNKQYRYGSDLNWSPDGNKLIFSLFGEDQKFRLWTLSINDGSLNQVTNSFPYGFFYPVFSKNGSNIIYKCGADVRSYFIKMKPATGDKSVSIIDSSLYFRYKFILSPDNQWIMYERKSGYNFLFRLVDKQLQKLSTPKEVGDIVSWADEGSKVFFYCPSYEEKNVIKVASIFGGPAFELGSEYGDYSLGWAPDSKGIMVFEKGEDGKTSLKIISLTNQISKAINGIENPGTYPSFSPDFSKIAVGLSWPGPADLSIVPVSLKDYKVTGKPILIFKGFQGEPGCSWSPDGKKIAVCSDGEVWICHAEGGAPLQLTKKPIIGSYPLWSPDGNAIAVYIQSTNQLLIISPSDGKVLNTFEKIDNFDWTPDGKEITIAFMDGQLNTVSLASGKTRKIANWKEISLCSGLNDLKWSPDGKWIAMNGYNENIVAHMRTFLINNVDGKASEFAVNEDENKETILWSPDSKWITYSSYGIQKTRLESTLWEADLTDFMKKMKPGTEKGFTTDFDFTTLVLPAGGVAPDGTFTDVRDGHVYKYKKIGEQTWMAENLAYLPEVRPDSDTSSVNKRCYVYGYKDTDVKVAKNTENYQKFGVLYNWPAAMSGSSGSNSVPSGVQGICPTGWHLPGDAEWMILEKTMGMNDADLVKEGPVERTSGSVGKKLKSSLGWDDDDIYIGQSGFNALPGGLEYRGASVALNKTVYFWTSTPFNDTKAAYRNFPFGLSVYRVLNASKELGLSIRCVKD